MSMASEIAHQPRTLAGRIWTQLWSLFAGTLLAMAAPTSILLLGWQMRQTRDAALVRSGLPSERVGWILGRRGEGYVLRLLGGLAANIRDGVLAAISLTLATLPFVAAWILSWWAGWENSFSKGYEQAFVGPALALAGTFIFALTMIYLPMALAHQAVERRPFSLFEYRQVKSAVRNSGWRYIMLALTAIFLALPIFGSRILVVFSEQIIPSMADYSPDQMAAFQSTVLIAKAAYVFVTLTFLRRWSGRIYADAVMRAKCGRDQHMWTTGALANAPGDDRSSRYLVGRAVRFILLFGIWVAFAIMLYFSQFMNHSWLAWITQPFTFLPWVI